MLLKVERRFVAHCMEREGFQELRKDHSMHPNTWFRALLVFNSINSIALKKMQGKGIKSFFSSVNIFLGSQLEFIYSMSLLMEVYKLVNLICIAIWALDLLIRNAICTT
ncbi:uncharacterized protein LOC131076517 [Cryptomeria japonica]|uniref:uncharacterized protein LOC131076517 n=1 Tax=Cryptomeria japonica TaxID=3369 RepID=UPI0025ACEC40|nr:uncharacterized protein LOC131076517 [Cryptomeria japonica]